MFPTKLTADPDEANALAFVILPVNSPMNPIIHLRIRPPGSQPPEYKQVETVLPRVVAFREFSIHFQFLLLTPEVLDDIYLQLTKNDLKNTPRATALLHPFLDEPQSEWPVENAEKMSFLRHHRLLYYRLNRWATGDVVAKYFEEPTLQNKTDLLKKLIKELFKFKGFWDRFGELMQPNPIAGLEFLLLQKLDFEKPFTMNNF